MARSRRTGKPPEAADTFLWRICKALDEPPRMLAANLGIAYSEISPLLDPRHGLVEIDRDETWWLISRYIDQRLGEIMAARVEMQRALESDRSKRAMRVVAMSERTIRSYRHVTDCDYPDTDI